MDYKNCYVKSVSRKYKGLQITYDKNMELIFGIFSAYLNLNEEYRDNELDFIETPNIEYAKEFYALIDFKKYTKLTEYIKEAFYYCSLIPNIAICMTDSYEFDESKYDGLPLGYGDAKEFADIIKKIAIDINFDDFYKKHNKLYVKFLDQFSSFSSKLDLSILEAFYGYILPSLNYIPSIFINGGFGPKDKNNNCYYIKGFEYECEKEKFYINDLGTVECLFHEFSHSYVNPLVDKYINYFTNLDKIHEDAVKHGLHKAYEAEENKRIILYEYIVRANTFILAQEVYKEVDIPEEILKLGFYKLYDLSNFIKSNKNLYPDYESFFREGLINFINNELFKELLGYNKKANIY